jgi:ubiquinone/menaquinone biosynthesis C-methylase UbiE
MVSLEDTRRKYYGQTALGYFAKRRKQLRWKLENKIVKEMLERELENHHQPLSVLDAPCGEGRFLSLYVGLKLRVTGLDSSADMLKLAAKRGWRPKELEDGDVTKLHFATNSHDFAVCVRFLDLIPEEAMRQSVRELCRVARHAVILTIRLGDEYVPKSNTATHDRVKFSRLVRSLGWHAAESVPIFKQGWCVMRLVPEHAR